jgi:uncharacterized protein (TIGR02444 family)
MGDIATTARFVADVVALYDGPGVKAACLELQDGSGADVSVMLAAAMLGLRGFALRGDGLKLLRDAGLDDLVQATDLVRGVRRGLAERHGWPSPLARRTLDAEIAVEMVQIAFIWHEREQGFDAAPPSLDSALVNLRRAAGPAAPVHLVEVIGEALGPFLHDTRPQDREHG